MSTLKYEIDADEAWTHQTPPLNRYWCFHAGLLSTDGESDRLVKALRAVLEARSHKGEVGWTGLTLLSIETYKQLVDVFFEHVNKHDLKFRQVFLDRSVIRVPEDGDQPLTPLDVQFRICYQFIKHALGLKYLCECYPNDEVEVIVRLDNHSSQHHKDRLQSHLEALPKHWGQDRLKVNVRFVNSKKYLILQMCDLLMGAAGSHGNKMHLRRQPGQRGMSSKQKLRSDMALYIYNHIRNLDASSRGSRAFNWFESTGKDGDWKNLLRHRLEHFHVKCSVYPQ